MDTFEEYFLPGLIAFVGFMVILLATWDYYTWSRARMHCPAPYMVATVANEYRCVEIKR